MQKVHNFSVMSLLLLHLINVFDFSLIRWWYWQSFHVVIQMSEDLE